MTHAMLFTGVDVHDGVATVKWRVENSWGDDEVGVKGFHAMNDSWFDEYMFEVAIEKEVCCHQNCSLLGTKNQRCFLLGILWGLWQGLLANTANACNGDNHWQFDVTVTRIVCVIPRFSLSTPISQRCQKHRG